MTNIPFFIFISIVIFLIIKRHNKFKNWNKQIFQKLIETKDKFILEDTYCTFKKYIFFEMKAYNVYLINGSIIIIYKYGLTKQTYIVSNYENEIFPFSLFQYKMDECNISLKKSSIIIKGKMSDQSIFNNNFTNENHLSLIIKTDLEENELKNQSQKYNLL